MGFASRDSDYDVRAALDELVARKQAGDELAGAPPVEALTLFLEAKLPCLEALNEPGNAAGEVDELNGFFRRYALVALSFTRFQVFLRMDRPLRSLTKLALTFVPQSVSVMPSTRRTLTPARSISIKASSKRPSRRL